MAPDSPSDQLGRPLLRQEFRTVMDRAPVAVMATNEAGYYVYGNAAAETLLGYPSAELQMHHIAELHAVDPQWFQAELELFRRTCFWNGRVVLRQAGGGLLKVAVNAFVDDLPGRCVYVCLSRPIPGDPSEIGRGMAAPAFDYPFTPREFAALQLLAEGFGDPEIADVLGIPRALAEPTIAGILRTLNAGSRTEACLIALKQHLIF
jgi:PAS domain S-box-containing protein